MKASERLRQGKEVPASFVGTLLNKGIKQLARFGWFRKLICEHEWEYGGGYPTGYKECCRCGKWVVIDASK